jgi:Tol biopolymer transport system component
VAQRLDLERQEPIGDVVTLANPVPVGALEAVSVSATGLIAYRPGRPDRRQLSWFDRSGRLLGTVGAADDARLTQPGVSPDGRRVAVQRSVQGNSDIWLLDGTHTNRFTFAGGSRPLWSPDGSRIVFWGGRNNRRQIYVKPASGAGSEGLLLERPLAEALITNDWSPDGRFVLYHSRGPQTYRDLWVLPLEGDRKPWAFLKTTFDEAAGDFSPDGRWVAYQSNESGRYEIYVRPFLEPVAAGAKGIAASGQWQVSTGGGLSARWRSDGKEIYYTGPDGRIMAASITTTATTLEPGTPVELFQTRIVGGGADTLGRQYDVARDGRFLINTVLQDPAAPIVILQNWRPATK